ncbi:IclR family transcriptional regulator [Sciscionella marina]|uniref:IclR family transcriptional regulator n=1 Tax=Sciscionella marina TaxID=508770 RepID=UPI000365C94F|nr:IclR family transcriptional regulator [Sciscionella marina]
MRNSADLAAFAYFPEQDRSTAPSAVSKALCLLDALGSGKEAEPLAVLAARAGLPKSTACRLLKTMETLGFVARKESLYCLGPRILELGTQANVASHHELRTASLPILERLYEEVRTTVHLGVLVGSEVLYLEKITAPGGVRIPTRVGTTLPAGYTALGRAQLAFSTARVTAGGPSSPANIGQHRWLAAVLGEVRRNGVAVDRGSYRAGLTCVATPVTVHGRVVAALSASSTGEVAYSTLRTEHVRAAASRLGRQLERYTQHVG